MKLRCAICNGDAEKSSFKRAPLPFFTTDQRIYVPGGLEKDEYKSFPLCKNCYAQLRKGTSFIDQHLKFPIGNAQGLSFWLIPLLDPSSAEGFFDHLKSEPIYLKNLRLVCRSLDTIEQAVSIQETEVTEEKFLTYTALFHILDKQGHMRLITSADGIYPNRLRKLINEKAELDKKYPYFMLDKFSPRLSKIRFGFPILADFMLHDKKTGGQKDLAELISSVYLGARVNNEFITVMLVKRIKEEFREAGVKVGIKKLVDLVELVFKALIMIEFLERLGVIYLPEESVLEYSSNPKDDLVNEFQKFLRNHQKVIVHGAQRAICCVGVLAGITLVEQEENIGSTSFWSRLNRLDMNFERVRSLVPQTVEKLRQYKATDKYKNLIAHILAEEISQLDEMDAKNLSNDLISLMFAIGLGEGYLLTKKQGELVRANEQG